jgi:hypothetical protein
MPAVALGPPHLTVMVPVPGSVRVPITHVHETCPLASAILGTNPCATLAVPCGVTWPIEHDAPGAVWTVILAIWPGRPPTTDRKVTPLVALDTTGAGVLVVMIGAVVVGAACLGDGGTGDGEIGVTTIAER